MYIYKITNKINGKFYVGKTQYSIDNRVIQHIDDAFKKKLKYHFHTAIRKHGIENFIVEEICECNTVDELDKMEIYYINKLNPNLDNNIGYNMMQGGHEERQKCSHQVVISEETKQAISKKMKERWKQGEYDFQKNNPNHGNNKRK